MITTPDPRFEWWEDAICQFIGDSFFFPGGAKGERAAATRQGKQICEEFCPVRKACLEAALREERGAAEQFRFGLRGGKTPRERQDIAMKRGELPKPFDYDYDAIRTVA